MATLDLAQEHFTRLIIERGSTQRQCIKGCLALARWSGKCPRHFDTKPLTFWPITEKAREAALIIQRNAVKIPIDPNHLFPLNIFGQVIPGNFCAKN